MNEPEREYKHYHSFLLWNTKKEFEPFHGGQIDGISVSVNSDLPVQLYKLVEYAFMFCKCGAVKKLRVEDESSRQTA